MGKKYPYRPEIIAVIDEIEETSCWNKGELPNWIEIQLSKTEIFNTIIIDSNIAKLVIEVFKEGVWQRIMTKEFLVEKKRRSKQTIDLQTITSDRLRIYSLAVSSYDSIPAIGTEIWEIEIYNQ